MLCNIFFPFLLFPTYRSTFNLIPADKHKKLSLSNNVKNFVMTDFYVLYHKKDIVKIIKNGSFKNNLYECQAHDMMSILKLLLENNVSEELLY